MRFSITLSIAILAVFASVQAKKPEEAGNDGEAQVQGQDDPQSKLGILPEDIPEECLTEHGEVIQECVDEIGGNTGLGDE
ncbi:hypothetical protein LRAMOSA03942 [Lichtheimia ramosa]|uniref:Uncharacterized protein n=1 Tax=Lichtheimia ramosa TaxID=688394 RepID=A0A077WWT9_9FUNG|nr:hypothetical protein LRAMOSA03942 [Lichtheimia ramosa]